MFCKEDLRNGDFILDRSYGVGVIVEGTIVYEDGGYMALSDYKNGFYLYDKGQVSSYDIVMVVRPITPQRGKGCGFRYAGTCIEQEKYVLYKETSIAPRKLTVAEIEEELGYKIEIVNK